MHGFSLWFCWFVDFRLVQCVAVLNVFVGTEACCLSVGHRHSGQPQTEPKGNEQNHQPNTSITTTQ
jgi:hypothetical protein